MRTELLPYQRIGGMLGNYGKAKEKKYINLNLLKKNLLLIPIAFLLGRASLVGGLMPFGMALYAASFGVDINRMLIAFFVVLGMVSSGAREQVYVTAAAMLLYNTFNVLYKNNKSKLTFRYSVIAFISILIPNIGIVYLQGFLLFDCLKALFQAFLVFSLTFIFRNVIPLVNENKKKYIFSSEEIISIAIIAAISLSGFSGMQVFGFELKNILSILLILVISYKCGPGVGAGVGVTVGLILSMSNTVTPLIISSYAFCGLLTGVLRKLGRMGACLGFVMGNAVLTLYLNGSTEVMVHLKEIIAAVVIFMFVPHSIIEALISRFDRNADNCLDKDSYSARIKEVTVDRLNKFSKTFEELSKTFGEIAETKVVANKQDISVLFDRVADKVCKDCSVCLHCWDRNFYNTYQIMFKVVEKLDSKGHIEESDIPDYFLTRCVRINDFVEAVNSIYELFKVDMVWKGKIGESRGLVSQQLEGLSKVISSLAQEIDIDIHFKGDLENVLLMELNKIGIKANEAMVFENKLGKYEISIFHKGCGGKRNCVSTIEKLVSDVVGRKMVKEGSECYHKPGNGACALRLVEEEIFRVTTGIAKVTKHNTMISGDNYSFMNTGDGKYILALSDGMGSGQRADTQSRATINLLEQFMEAGFDKDTTIKLINSILVLKSSDDSFATIDLSVIDLFGGNVEFVKIGAVPTYIKKGEIVEMVKMASLPAGILSIIEVELVQKQVESGDFIIMMTDGVLDSFQNEESDSARTVQSFVQDIKSINPQEIADTILNKAYSNYDGKPADDMMVVVAKVWKRVD